MRCAVASVALFLAAASVAFGMNPTAGLRRGPAPCEPPIVEAVGSRYVAVTPQPPGSSTPVALRATSPDYPSLAKYVDAAGGLRATPVFRTPAQWDTVYVHGVDITPQSTYRVEADCGSGVFSAAVTDTTWRWGDGNNNGLVDLDDVFCVLDGFADLFPLCTPQSVDFARCAPDGLIDLDDVFAVLDAFADEPPPWPGPGEPPPAAPVLLMHKTMTNQPMVTISGTAPRIGMVEVSAPEGVFVVPVMFGQFTANVPLSENRINNVYFTAISPCEVRSAPAAAAITHDAQSPSLFIDFPANGAELTTAATDVAGRVGDVLSGFMGLTVFVNGQQAITHPGLGNNGTFVRSGVPLGVGSNLITVVAMDALGNVSQPREITITRVEIPPDVPQMTALLPMNGLRIAPIGSVLNEPIVVHMTHGNGSDFAGKVVTFDVTRSNGRLGATEAEVTPISDPMDPDYNLDPGSMMFQMHTDMDGLATAYWRLGSDAGCGNNRVAVVSTDIAGSVFFCASATPGPAAQINTGSGNNQRAEVGSPAPMPLNAWVSDSCNGIPNIAVTFTVLSGGGLVNGQAGPVMVSTDPTGHADVSFTLGPDPGNNMVKADYVGNLHGPALFVAYGLARAGTQPASFSGLILDNASQPLGGAIALLFVRGIEIGQDVSDADGQFRIDGITDSGDADLLIYAETIDTVGGNPIPAGIRFPPMHYETFVVAAAENSLPGPVLLPPLRTVNDRIFTGGQATDLVLTCEGMDGIKMIVKAGTTITLAGGQRIGPSDPGMVTLALNQVHHDDIPMPIPDGAAPPFAWTLQPSGATFDPPVEIEYPNMSGLPPGAISNFLSFNHDISQFQIIGSGTVSADGSTIRSDPGVGIATSGWGCNCPPYSVTGQCCHSEGRAGGGFDCCAAPCPPCQEGCDGDCVPIICVGECQVCEDVCQPPSSTCCPGGCAPDGNTCCPEGNSACATLAQCCGSGPCCASGEVCCDDHCYAPGSECCEGTTCQNAQGDVWCCDEAGIPMCGCEEGECGSAPTDCCAGGLGCVNGQCCGGGCITDTLACCNGMPCPPGQACCGNNCTPPGQQCCHTGVAPHLCAMDQCCGQTCCDNGEVCCNSVCRPQGSVCCPTGGFCPPSQECCGDAVCINPATHTCCFGSGGGSCPLSTPVCCPPGGTLTQCCPPNSECCGTACCGHPQVCCGGTCYPEGTQCCGDGSACAPSFPVCCPDHCCPANQICCGPGCCPSGTTCCLGPSGADCCNPGQTCNNGLCQ